jgi:hypothetical protein
MTRRSALAIAALLTAALMGGMVTANMRQTAASPPRPQTIVIQDAPVAPTLTQPSEPSEED